jgi:hypothetical protein
MANTTCLMASHESMFGVTNASVRDWISRNKDDEEREIARETFNAIEKEHAHGSSHRAAH